MTDDDDRFSGHECQAMVQQEVREDRIIEWQLVGLIKRLHWKALIDRA